MGRKRKYKLKRKISDKRKLYVYNNKVYFGKRQTEDGVVTRVLSSLINELGGIIGL